MSTYALYCLLLRVVDYRMAYTASFIAGLMLGYLLNSIWVFRRKPTLRSALAYPLLVLVQYAVSVSLLALFVERFGVQRELAPIFVILLVFPVMYLAMKCIFSRLA